MAKEQIVSAQVDAIQKALAQNKALLGTKQTLKQIKAGTISQVYLSTNVPSAVSDDVMHYAELTKTPVEKLSMDNEELSVICKKPFRISIVSIHK